LTFGNNFGIILLENRIKRRTNMFIKILTPNHNGKIELTVKDLEALIQEAVDKAIREDRANRPYNYYCGTGLLSTTTTTPYIDKVTCTGEPLQSHGETISLNGGFSISSNATDTDTAICGKTYTNSTTYASTEAKI
jgi:hypothetical protein